MIYKVAAVVLMSFLFCIWAVGMWSMSVVAVLSLVYEKLAKRSVWVRQHGNCWSFAMPKWLREGGYLALRPAYGVSFLRLFFVPHAIHIKSLGEGAEISQFGPVRRHSSKWLPFFVVMFKGKVSSSEKEGCGD